MSASISSACKVRRDLLAVERDEACLVRTALAQGLPTEHRSDCSVQAILQCQLVTVPAANGGSSPQHTAFHIIGR